MTTADFTFAPGSQAFTVTSNSGVSSVNGQTGAVVLSLADAGSTTWLINRTLEQAWSYSSATYDVHGAALSASIAWEDGATGTYTADTVSTAWPGCVDAYHVTYVPATGPTKTIRQLAVTRNSAGSITTSPPLTVS